MVKGVRDKCLSNGYLFSASQASSPARTKFWGSLWQRNSGTALGALLSRLPSPFSTLKAPKLLLIYNTWLVLLVVLSNPYLWVIQEFVPFPSVFFPKMKAISRVEFELIYYNVAVEYINHKVTRTFLLMLNKNT